VAIAVWGSRGPTIVRVAEAPSPVHISMRHGTVMSLSGTASGRLFAAHLPKAKVRAALANEAAPEAELLEEVRRQGIASSKDGVVAGVSALAAPVFDEEGRIVLSLTAIGPSGSFDLRLNGKLAPELRRAGLELSRQLGWRPA
jgi:DNA-binding IclR family transcriptional regulator